MDADETYTWVETIEEDDGTITIIADDDKGKRHEFRRVVFKGMTHEKEAYGADPLMFTVERIDK